jgi:hypothetical protein
MRAKVDVTERVKNFNFSLASKQDPSNSYTDTCTGVSLVFIFLQHVKYFVRTVLRKSNHGNSFAPDLLEINQNL